MAATASPSVFTLRIHSQESLFATTHPTRMSTFFSGDKSIHIDQHEPTTPGRHPAILLLHGSGGNVSFWSDRIAPHLTRPNIDPNRIALLGISLGAFLSLALATDPATNIRAIVEISGGLPDPYAANATSAFPPMLILHGGARYLCHGQRCPQARGSTHRPQRPPRDPHLPQSGPLVRLAYPAPDPPRHRPLPVPAPLILRCHHHGWSSGLTRATAHFFRSRSVSSVRIGVKPLALAPPVRS